ncbi:hypothetical protein L227DRAFT_579261 [Lentinus tigrinus ALCF2SS1-6]|uniref:RING-type domain-containing protein n=1 Tax=Lentinus tigrinus ALCF2SS1-6 TaxID=1328759 RepID=A0A5C2RY99_9APHY|nr:hypothetical protein L227DRAFT_579261 [Lentinus tigrinus ALCF2SS1-6]
MSDGRGMPLLSGPPPEYSASESACRKCNKEFNILFARSRKCNHCGYSYCHSCTDYQALMPRRGADAGSTSGYDPLPVCAFCIEMLQITASGKGQLKQLPMAKLKKYAKAYNIDVAGLLEKDEFIDKLVAVRGPDGCLPRAYETYYRKHSVPNRTNNRPRGLFTRAMDAMSGERSSTSSQSPQPQRPQAQYHQSQQYPGQYAQYQPRQRTTSGPSRYAPNGYPGAQQQQPQYHYAPPPSQSYPQYAPPPGYPPGYNPSTRPASSNSNNNSRPQMRPRAASATHTPRATSPARPVIVPSMDQLLEMSDEQIAALSIGSLKEVLFKNHVTARLVVEKGELVDRVKTLVVEEKAERERKAREEEAERQLEEEMRRARDEEARARAGPPQPATQDTPSENPADEPESTPPPTASPPPASTLTPKAQAMASRLERTGLCVICQDEEANIAIVDCGHLAMCRPCSDLIMNSTRECPLCRTRIVTESRLLRIFKS